MATAKVILNGTTLIDVTQKTVTSATMLDGVTALKNDGTDITGSYTAPAGTKQITISSAGTTTEDVTNYASAEITVGAGTEGTPTASKGAVNSHSIAVTPSVTNSAGYISGGTKTGTAVTVSASELVSGTYSVTGSGTANVTNYASISVPSGSATTPATSVTATPSISVSSGGLITASVSTTKSVTPSVSAGYVSSGTAGTVSVSGSNTSQLPVYAGAHHSGGATLVQVTINSDGAYTVSLPSGASQSGDVVSIPANGTFTVYGSFELDSISQTGTVTRQVISFEERSFEVLVDAGASGGTISFYEMK